MGQLMPLPSRLSFSQEMDEQWSDHTPLAFPQEVVTRLSGVRGPNNAVLRRRHRHSTQLCIERHNNCFTTQGTGRRPIGREHIVYQACVPYASLQDLARRKQPFVYFPQQLWFLQKPAGYTGGCFREVCTNHSIIHTQHSTIHQTSPFHGTHSYLSHTHLNSCHCPPSLQLS